MFSIFFKSYINHTLYRILDIHTLIRRQIKHQSLHFLWLICLVITAAAAKWEYSGHSSPKQHFAAPEVFLKQILNSKNSPVNHGPTSKLMLRSHGVLQPEVIMLDERRSVKLEQRTEKTVNRNDGRQCRPKLKYLNFCCPRQWNS